MPNTKQWMGIAAAFLVAAGVMAGVMLPPRFDGNINALGVDLAQPQAYVSTAALSRLPRDLIKAPVARDLLTEDFAFYYEEHEDRLNLRGAIKRIAFEHETTLSDRLIAAALDEPAEIAWWTDAKGAPRHWLMAMTRGMLARGIEAAATLAANDRQLSVIASLHLDGNSVNVYALVLSPRRTLAFAALGNRVVVLSDPGLLFDANRKVDSASRDVIASLLSSDAQAQAIYRRGFGIDKSESGHTLIADARLMSFGYQHFFPGLKALRFDLSAGGTTLRTQLRVAGAPMDDGSRGNSLWSGLPIGPAACALLPADWQRLGSIVAEAPEKSASAADRSAWARLAAQFEGPAAICWYARSQMHTPLVVARLKSSEPDADASLAAMSRWMLSANPGAGTDAKTANAIRGQWQREVAAPWGPRGAGSVSSYLPTLAREGRWLSFSPDEELVRLARDAQARRFPSLIDALPPSRSTLAVLGPAQIAELVQREAFDVLPPQQELFRQAAENHLVPRLIALRRLPPVRVVAVGKPDGQGWVPIEWQSFTMASPAQGAKR